MIPFSLSLMKNHCTERGHQVVILIMHQYYPLSLTMQITVGNEAKTKGNGVSHLGVPYPAIL